MHELGENTKRIIDAGSAAIALTVAGVAGLTLADWALIATIITCALSGALAGHALLRPL